MSHGRISGKVDGLVCNLESCFCVSGADALEIKTSSGIGVSDEEEEGEAESTEESSSVEGSVAAVESSDGTDLGVGIYISKG